MTRLDQLLTNFRRHASFSPRANVPLSQRIWFVVYPPDEERRMTNRIPEFEIAARDEGLEWRRIEFTGAFADWMDTFDEDERSSCLSDPEIVENYSDPGFRDFLCSRIRDELKSVPEDKARNTVFAVSGLMELYDFIHVSSVLGSLDTALQGILVVFFPGEREGNTYRFLGARTGWDYLATPILADN